MVIFKSIKYKNFLSSGNIPITIQIDSSPVTVIAGENGSGKSSGIIDAVFFAIYGKPYRKLKKEQMINSINKKQLEVELVFSVGIIQYKIIRGIKPNKFEIYENGILKPQPASLKDYQTWLEDSVLKMNAVTLRQIVFLGSTSYVPFMRLCPNDRRKVVEDILDIQVFSIMNVLLRGRAVMMKTKYEEIQSRLKLLANNITLKQQHLSEIISQKDDQIKNSKKQIETLICDIDTIRQEVKKSMKCVDEYLNEINDASKVKGDKSELSVLVSNMTKNKSRAQKEKVFFEENDECPTCSQDILDTTKQTYIASNEEKISKFVAALNMAQIKINEYETRLSEISKIEATIHKEELLISNNQTRINVIQNHISGLHVSIEKISQTENDKSSNKSLENEIVCHESESVKLRDERSEIANEIQYYQVVSSLLKDGGIKSQIINNYLPTINSLIRKYLEILEFPCEFVFDDEFNETLKSRYRDTFSYANFSEGQKLRIDLALLFSWRELARLRNSATCNLLVLDEVGSSSLDSEGTSAFMRIIEKTSKDNNVFIISHDISVTENDTFSRCLEYKLVDNFSTVTESA